MSAPARKIGWVGNEQRDRTYAPKVRTVIAFEVLGWSIIGLFVLAILAI